MKQIPIKFILFLQKKLPHPMKFLGIEPDDTIQRLDNKLNQQRIEIQGQKPNKLKKQLKPNKLENIKQGGDKQNLNQSVDEQRNDDRTRNDQEEQNNDDRNNDEEDQE